MSVYPFVIDYSTALLCVSVCGITALLVSYEVWFLVVVYKGVVSSFISVQTFGMFWLSHRVVFCRLFATGASCV